MTPLCAITRAIACAALVNGIWLSRLQDRPDPSKTWALIIGISRYAHAEPLEFAASDAQSFQHFLTSPRGGGIPPDHLIVLLEDQASRKSVEVELESMQTRLKPGDSVYVFIAGHGHITNRGIGYFIPSDGDMRVPASTALSFTALKELIELGLGNAQLRILITDLCHAGRIGPQETELAGKIQELINAELVKFAAGNKSSYLNLLSSHPLEKSWESGKLKSGVFSHTLMEALNGKAAVEGSSVVRARELVAYLRAEVPKSTGGRQTPLVNDDFDPALALSFLDQPATPSGDAPGTSAKASLSLLNLNQAGYVRVQWIDPQTEAVAVRLVQWPAGSVELESLTPGELELLFFDAQKRSYTHVVKVRPGPNILDVTELKGARQGYAPFALQHVSVTINPRSSRSPYFTQAAEARGEASVLMKLDSGTEVYLDEDFFGSSPGPDRYMHLQGLPAGAHELFLIISPEREQRFRVTLSPGRQIFDTRSGEVRAVISIHAPPQFLPVPATVPAAGAELYRTFAQTLWEERLVEPPGLSAADYFDRLRPTIPVEVAESIRNSLVIAMGDKAQRIILKYLRGGDIRWSAAAFDEGAALVARLQKLHGVTDMLRAQEMFFRGRAHIERGQHAEAAGTLQQSLELDRSASHALNALGLAFWKQNLLDQAIVPLEQAISLSPDWTYPKNTVGLIRLEQRRYAEAEKCFLESVKSNPEDSMAYHCLAQLELLLDHPDDAESELRRAFVANPGNAYAFETLGKLYQRRQQWDRAELVFRTAIKLEPEEVSFRLSMAELLEKAGRSADAESFFKQALTRFPAEPRIILGYAAFLAAAKRDREAETTFRQAVAHAAQDAGVLVRYGLFLNERGRTEDAIRQLKAALRIAPRNTYAHHNLAVAYLAARKVEDAEKELDSAMKADPRYPAPPFLLGDLRFTQGRFAEALEAYLLALKLSIDSSQRQAIEGKIAQCQDALLKEKIATAAKLSAGNQHVRAWSILGGELKTLPESRALRDALLALQSQHPDSADPSLLPPCSLTTLLNTEFWREQLRSETLWSAGRKTEAFEAILSAVRLIKPEERPILLSVYLNLGNESHGIHARFSRWTMRLVEERSYAAALRLMDESIHQKIFGIVPGMSVLTIDSLMIPADNPSPRDFAGFEVAHHPDTRAHTAYAAAHGGLGNLEHVNRYLAALEGSNAELPARLAAARAFRNEKHWQGAVAVLREAATREKFPSQKDHGPEVSILLADSECRAGDCAAARRTLEAGLKSFPDSKALKQALRELRK